MTTTYEIYTNDGGTPKAVTGNAPAIVERVEALEETLDNGVVTSVNGKTGVVSLDVGVTSVNGETGDVTVDVGVTSVNGNTGKVTPEQTGCLPLGGGTMTGAIGFNGIGYIQCKDSTSNGIQIYGANAFADGAFLGIYGKDHSSRGGWVYINCTDGTNSNALIGKPDGMLTWASKNVVRSVNGTTADASGNVTLAVSNGTVSQKHNSTFNASEAGVTKTISSLTANKPVYIGVLGVDVKGYVTVQVTSGTAVNSTYGDYTPNCTNVAHTKISLWLTAVPTGTSLGISFYASSDDYTRKVQLVVYQ